MQQITKDKRNQYTEKHYLQTILILIMIQKHTNAHTTIQVSQNASHTIQKHIQ